MRREILHHGLCSGEFRPRYVGTDYFAFRHEPCKDKEGGGHCQITRVLIDNQGRVIFNLKCRSCGKIDALKTHPYLWVRPKPRLLPFTRIFKLSPALRPCVSKHWWDDL